MSRRSRLVSRVNMCLFRYSLMGLFVHLAWAHPLGKNSLMTWLLWTTSGLDSQTAWAVEQCWTSLSPCTASCTRHHAHITVAIDASCLNQGAMDNGHPPLLPVCLNSLVEHSQLVQYMASVRAHTTEGQYLLVPMNTGLSWDTQGHCNC